MREPTKTELNKLFIYLPETGHLLWKEKISRKIIVGSLAGSYHDIRRGIYRTIRIKRKGYLAHRLIWVMNIGAIPKGKQVDHINGKGEDNRIENLRLVSAAQNQKNMKRDVRNTSGVTGVYLDKITGKWFTRINVNKVQIYLGSFIEKVDAIKARKEAEVRYDFHPNHGRVIEEVHG